MLKMGNIEYPSLKGKVSDAEWQTRVELAALYRAVELGGWNDLTQAPISAKVPGEPYYLFNPSGILFDEITASSLVKITIDGDVVSESPFGIVRGTWYPMKAVHAVREDANFLVHNHGIYAAALSARKDLFLPVSQDAGYLLAMGVAYHPYDGVETEEHQIPALQVSLGTSNILFMHNHGVAILAPDPWFALYGLSSLQKACQVQVLAGRGEDLIQMSEDVINLLRSDIMKGPSLGNLWQSMLRRLDRIDPSYKD